MAPTGERENAAAVRCMWDLFERRKWDEAVSKFAADLVVYWPHTGEIFRGGQNFVEMNRAYPDWDHIAIDRIVAKGNLVVSQSS